MRDIDLLNEIYQKVLKALNGDLDKAKAWFLTPSPLLGEISPVRMIETRRLDKLAVLVDALLDGYSP